jgi:hypothetical protein
MNRKNERVGVRSEKIGTVNTFGSFHGKASRGIRGPVRDGA